MDKYAKDFLRGALDGRNLNEIDDMCDLLCGGPHDEPDEELDELEGVICCRNCTEYIDGHCMRFDKDVTPQNDEDAGLYECFLEKKKQIIG
jgi:hypothetical protein